MAQNASLLRYEANEFCYLFAVEKLYLLRMPVSPPRPRGPHLNALRAFEAAARLGSFSAAAEELGVTSGAITQHVKSLEAWAGAPLFTRNARGIALTALSEALLPAFSTAFNQLGEAVHQLRSGAEPRRIHIATLPSIAQLWLPARLEALRRVAPDITVSVTALESPPNLAREQFDLAIFFYDGTPNPAETAIAEDRIFPVCTPSLAARLKSLDDLALVTLLRDATWSDDWALWFAAAGHPIPEGRNTQTYSLFAVALEEALRGAGVLMSHAELVTRQLASGELVRPFVPEARPNRRLAMCAARSFSRRGISKLLEGVFTKD